MEKEIEIFSRLMRIEEKLSDSSERQKELILKLDDLNNILRVDTNGKVSLISRVRKIEEIQKNCPVYCVSKKVTYLVFGMIALILIQIGPSAGKEILAILSKLL